MLTINEYEWFIIALSKFGCMKENSQHHKGNSLVIQAMQGFNFNVQALVPDTGWVAHLISGPEKKGAVGKSFLMNDLFCSLNHYD